MPKDMFGCPLKLILRFLKIFGIKLKYSYTIMYDCEKSSLTHELSLYWTIQFFSLKFVSYKYYLIVLKFPSVLFSFFGTPTVNGPYSVLFPDLFGNCGK